MTEATHVAIIGGGMAGCAAAYFLARAGVSCVLLEAGQVGHEGGGSSGETRMYRQMYSDEYFSELASTALGMWHELSDRHGRELPSPCGLLFYGQALNEETIEGSIPGARAIMTRRGVRFEDIDAATLQRRWPMRADPDFEGLFEPTAGTIWSRLTLQVMRAVAEQSGARIQEREAVHSIDAGPRDTVRLRISRGSHIVAKRLIIAAGAWSNTLLAHLGLGLDIEIWPMHWGHYRVQTDLAPRYPQWFCFQQGDPDQDGGLYYGFPAAASEPVIKVGIDWCPRRLRVRDMAEFPTAPDPELAGYLDRFLTDNWVGIGERVEIRCNPYAMTADNAFVLDTLPEYPQISIFTGDSGHAFKFAPLIGLLLADLALDRTPNANIGRLSASRPAVNCHRR